MGTKTAGLYMLVLASLAWVHACTSDGVSVAERCRSQCALPGPCADTIAREDYPSFALTRDEWSAECDGTLFVVAGSCRDGARVLARGTGFTSEIRVYDADESFRGLLAQTDSVDSVCQGQSYWPEIVFCEDPITTEVLCGQNTDVGDPVFIDRWSDLYPVTPVTQ